MLCGGWLAAPGAGGDPGLSADASLFIEAASVVRGEIPSLCLCSSPWTSCDPPKPPSPAAAPWGYHLPSALLSIQPAHAPRAVSQMGSPLASHLCRPPRNGDVEPEPPRPPTVPCKLGAAAAAPRRGSAAQLQRCALGLSPGKITPRAGMQQEWRCLERKKGLLQPAAHGFATKIYRRASG